MRSLRQLAQHLKRDTYAVYLASKDPRVPWYAKALAIAIVAYAFSPIDLIPDFIPIIGYLDDLLIVPTGIWILIKLIPPQVFSECRQKAQAIINQKHPTNWTVAIIIIILWFSLGILALIWIHQRLNP